MTNKRSRIHCKHWKNSLSNRVGTTKYMFMTETRVSISALPLETRDNGETQFSRFFKSRQVPEQQLICLVGLEKRNSTNKQKLILRWLYYRLRYSMVTVLNFVSLYRIHPSWQVMIGTLIFVKFLQVYTVYSYIRVC